MESGFNTRDVEFPKENSTVVNFTFRKGLRPIVLQRQVVETPRRKTVTSEHAAGIAEFVNDMFHGTVKQDNKLVYDLIGGRDGNGAGRVGIASIFDDTEDLEDSSSVRSLQSSSNKSKTQEWLKEAQRIVAASSPSGNDSPGRLCGSPRFAAAQTGSSPSLLNRRDPLSRSARRHRTVDSFSEEIVSKSAQCSRDQAELSKSYSASQRQSSSASDSASPAVQKWFSNILKPNNNGNKSNPAPSSNSSSNASALSHQEQNVDKQPALHPKQISIPPRHSVHRKSRFQSDPSATVPPGIPIPSRRSCRTSMPSPDAHLLSPPKNVTELGHRRSSSSISSTSEKPLLSPPRKLVESANRRSISSSTCSLKKIATNRGTMGSSKLEDENQDVGLNWFIKRQRTLIERLLNGDINGNAKVILSGPSNSTTSMIAAICYAWLLENSRRNGQRDGRHGNRRIVVPVMNVKRERMWKLRQVSWLFYHAGLDAKSLLFADEVELEHLMMAGKLKVLVVGQDILRKTDEVGSQCTILTDHFCEDAYDLLQSLVLKRLLLGGILLDTDNINANATTSMTRDAEAVQLLLAGSAPNYRSTLFDQLMQDQKDVHFVEAMSQTYGKPSKESDAEVRGREHRVQISRRNSSYISHHEGFTQNPRRNSTSADTISNHTNRLPSKSGKASSPPSQRTSVASATSPAAQEAPRAKNKFSLAKWFGLG